MVKPEGNQIRHTAPVTFAVVIAVLGWIFAAWLGLSSRAAAQPAGPLEDLWLDIGLGPPLVNWFNEFARPEDIARANSIEQVDLLDGITSGRKLVVFKSVAVAEEQVPKIAQDIDIIGYNLEHGPANPPGEQADPVGSIRRVRALADRHGLQVALGPDHDFAVSHGMAMAPYVDIFVLQIQRVQTEPEEVKRFVLPLAEQIERANPAAEISVQVRTEGDVAAVTALLAELEPHLDGISVLTSPETVDTAVELVSAIRPAEPIPAVSPAEASPAEPPGPSGNVIISGPDYRPGSFRIAFVAGSLTTLFGLGFVTVCAGSSLVALLVGIVIVRLIVRGASRSARS